MTTLPDWLTQGTFATDGMTVFAVAKVQKAQPPRKDLVLVDSRDQRYSLPQCNKAALSALPQASRFVDPYGHEWALSLVGDIALIGNTALNEIRRVRLSGLRNAVSVDAAAKAIAQAFDGAIVEDWDDADAT